MSDILVYLSVNEDDRAQESPGTALSVHVQHAQDLQEPDASDGRGGNHLTVVANDEDGYGCQDTD